MYHICKQWIRNSCWVPLGSIRPLAVQARDNVPLVAFSKPWYAQLPFCWPLCLSFLEMCAVLIYFLNSWPIALLLSPVATILSEMFYKGRILAEHFALPAEGMQLQSYPTCTLVPSMGDIFCSGSHFVKRWTSVTAGVGRLSHWYVTRYFRSGSVRFLIYGVT